MSESVETWHYGLVARYWAEHNNVIVFFARMPS